MFNFEKLGSYKENNQLEVKKAAGGLPNSIWETYSAFANTDGGTILLGVEEKSDKSLNIVGLISPEKIISDFWNSINNRNKVNINILTNSNVQILNADNKNVVAISIPRASRAERPVYIDNNLDSTFRRNGEGDYRCQKEEILSMLRDNAIKT